MRNGVVEPEGVYATATGENGAIKLGLHFSQTALSSAILPKENGYENRSPYGPAPPIHRQAR
jgi:hypothetical protein